MGCVYLIHFNRPYKHARHYLGYADNLDGRIKHHREGNGANFMRVVTEAGISWDVSRVWEGEGRDFERKLKNGHNVAHYCPVCRKTRKTWEKGKVMSKKEPLKIVEFKAANTKRLRAVTIRPDPEKPVVVLTGKNRVGKSSVLDAIWFALGGQRAIPSRPIRDGESEAVVTLDLGEYIVERRFTGNGDYLEVKTKDGFKAPKPQTFLASRLGDRASNPLEFMRLKPDEQVKALQNLIEIKLDLAELERISGLSTKGVKADDPILLLDSAYKHLYEERTTVNAEVKRLEGAIKTVRALIPPGKESTEKVSVAELFEKRKELEAQNQANETQRVNLGLIDSGYQAKCQTLQSIEQKIHEVEAELRRLRGKQHDLIQEMDAVNTEREKQLKVVEALVDPDFSEIDVKIAAADELNTIYGHVSQLRKHQDELASVQEKAAGFTERLTSIKEYKAKLILEAGLPVENLGFENGEVTYKGLPLSQASTAEQIDVSCAICMAAHPEIGILTLDIGWSELDHESRQILSSWANKNGVQVWVTKVVDELADSEGFFIENGELKGINGQPVQQQEETNVA